MKKRLFIGLATLVAAVAFSVSVNAHSNAQAFALNGFCDYSQGNEEFGTCVPDPIIHECDTALGTNGAPNTACLK